MAGREGMITVRVINKNEEVIASAQGCREVSLALNHLYEEGDRIVLGFSQAGTEYILQPDDAMLPSQVFVPGGKTDTQEEPCEVSFLIPFGEKKVCYSPKLFSGENHLITARQAEEWEISAYRNLAENPMDQHGSACCYPHASANVETRGESVFAARNAIDGITENHSHGYWPYGSWGINRDPQAALTLDFGREVLVDAAELTLRADFPHDAWWKQATLRFSDGSSVTVDLVKTDEGQRFSFPEKKITWLVLEKLIKADDPSPFPALTQIRVFGRPGRHE